MIEINLLPEELKKAKTKACISKEQLIYIIPALAGILLVAHLYFIFMFLAKGLHYKILNKKWMANRSVIEQIEAWKKENKVTTEDTQEIIRLLQTRINFSAKLKSLSEVLPDGIWFEHLSIKQKNFLLEGTVVSLKDEHMSLLRNFSDALKNNNSFFSGFTRLELGPVNMREYKGYRVMDFSLEGNLK